MARKKDIKIFHIANIPLSEPSLLSSQFVYQWISPNYDFIEDEGDMQIFINSKYNKKLHSAIFIFENESPILENVSLIAQLPAYQIFYLSDLTIPKPVQRILDLKGSYVCDVIDDNFYEFINKQFSARQLGFKLSMNHMKLSTDIPLKVEKSGNAMCHIETKLTDQFQQVVSWKMTNLINQRERMAFYAEIRQEGTDAELKMKINLIKENTNEIVEVIDISHESLLSKEVQYFESSDCNAYINVTLFARGNDVDLTIGQIHIRRAMADESIMIPGGKRICDEKHLSDEVIYYFNPGDLKPPLAVYFSGYRSAEGFEGRGMMGSMGCPFILIGDPRLEGGNFYLGSSDFEQKIVDIILEKLKLLNFKTSDLILSGLSMGTFGALYYASDLTPNSVIVGKPLTNLGTIALNERILRPTGFPTSLDMMKYNQGSITQEAAEKLDNRFWNKFKKGHYEQTTFAIAYMKQDDYDINAFPMLFDFFKTSFPTTRVLYKGMIGRHNDDSSSINKWFLKQYRNILVNTFNRDINRIL